MAGYVTVPRSYTDDGEYEDAPLLPALTVFEEDDLVDTGILDASGNRLYRRRERVRMGYRWT